MKTWRRNGATLTIQRLADGWWQAWVKDSAGFIYDAAICARPFPLLRALARGFRRCGFGAAVAVVLSALPALAGEKWGKMCQEPPAPKEHYLKCPRGTRPVWRCKGAPCPPGVCEPGQWSWQEECEAIPKKK